MNICFALLNQLRTINWEVFRRVTPDEWDPWQANFTVVCSPFFPDVLKRSKDIAFVLAAEKDRSACNQSCVATLIPVLEHARTVELTQAWRISGTVTSLPWTRGLSTY